MKLWSRTIWIPLPITIGVVSSALVVVFSLCFILLPVYRAEITFLAASAGAAGAITGAFYVGQGLRLSTEAAQTQMALHYIELWNSPHFFHAKRAFGKLMRRVVADQGGDRLQVVKDALQGEGDQGDQNFANLIEVLNLLEGLALATRVGAANEQIAGDFFKTIVRRAYEYLEDWIKERRREVGPRAYRELEGLYGRWRT